MDGTIPGAGTHAPDVYLFNPFAEAFWARGSTFTPNQAQQELARDLESLPRFLASDNDIVLVSKRPSVDFEQTLTNAGFSSPELIDLPAKTIPTQHPLRERALGQLRPWAWGPDSEELLKPLFGNACIPRPSLTAELYSKAWSAQFLREELKHQTDTRLVCTELEVGTTAYDLEDALESIRRIRSQGHHRIVVKQSLGLAGHNALRLWEPELLAGQRRWIERSLAHGSVLVEPWLERVLDFSLQLEMTATGLQLLGYTGLLNDTRGQYQANWAELGFTTRLPAKAPALLGTSQHELDEVYSPLLVRLEKALSTHNYIGPIGIDAFIYRKNDQFRLKPVVEFNPRFTMGRVTIELMRKVSPDSSGEFRLVPIKLVLAQGCQGFAEFAANLSRESPLDFDPANGRIRDGWVCLNDPSVARSVMAIFRATPNRRDLA